MRAFSRWLVVAAITVACAHASAAGTGAGATGGAGATPIPPPLPEPLAAPDDLQSTIVLDAGSVPPPPDDLEEFLYAHRINFAAGGAPLVTVRLMEGQDQVELSGDSELKLILHGVPDSEGKQVGVPAHQPLRIRLRESTPATLREFAQVADLKIDDRVGLREAKSLWEGRGFQVQVRTIGTVYGVAGRVLDNRRSLVLLGQGGGTEQAQSLLAQVRRDYGDSQQLSAQIYEELSRRPTGVLEVQDQTGATVAASRGLVAIDSPGDMAVRRVEYGVGYAFHGFQDRRYHGRLFVAVDKLGKLALIEALPLEELLRGLVPSEMFANAPAEALKAQAITARGEVLAKIGARHLTDPYLLCSEQHCQVYGGLGSERASTDAAVRATRGEALFSQQGRLVDSVYSAVCGGHTEDNDVVWGGPPDSSLRGVSDLVAGESGDLRDEVQLRRWIDRTPQSYCRISGAAPSSKIRWTKRFTAAELTELLAPLGVGHVLRLEPRERGASGRAAVLHVVGDRGEADVHGELRIRKLLKNLNSSAFYVEAIATPEAVATGTTYPTAFVFHGAGWGHGVGMCQTGAIGRANQGAGYRQILSHYFNGAELTRIY